MFDMPLFPIMDWSYRRNCACRTPQPCTNPCRSDEYIVKVCGTDCCGNMILAVKKR